MTMEILEVVKTVADMAIAPLVAMIYSVQGRLSRIEGRLDSIVPLLTKGIHR